jgi:hypothetical protein
MNWELKIFDQLASTNPEIVNCFLFENNYVADHNQQVVQGKQCYHTVSLSRGNESKSMVESRKIPTHLKLKLESSVQSVPVSMHGLLCCRHPTGTVRYAMRALALSAARR